jgi:hypothetical protein
MEFQVAALAELRRQFVGALDAEVVTRARWRPQLRAWTVPAVATAVMLLIVAVLAFPAREGVSVAEATAAISKTALEAPYPPDDWFTYTEARLTGREYAADRGIVGTGRFTARERKAWLSVAHGGQIVTRDLSAPSAAPVRVEYPAATKYRIGARGYTRTEIDAFAEDPAPLFADIDATSGSVSREDRATSKWQILTDALRGLAPPLPAGLRASMIRELATVPGAAVIDEERDPSGVLASGLQLKTQDLIDSVYFDRASAATSFASTVAAKDGANGDKNIEQGDVIESYTLERSEAVRASPEE